jgi:DNA cross-link repair 1B protein
MNSNERKNNLPVRKKKGGGCGAKTVMALEERLGLIPELTEYGIRISVDLFWRSQRYNSHNVRAFFLTHAHSDHTRGLTPTWPGGNKDSATSSKVYCTRTTANLASARHGVHKSNFQILNIGKTYCVYLDDDRVTSVHVTVLDANHCAGSVSYLFRVPSKEYAREIRRKLRTSLLDDEAEEIADNSVCSGEKYVYSLLHTGDFRYEDIVFDAGWLNVIGSQKIDCLYLDDTYLDPEADFPQRSEVAADILKFCQGYFDAGYQIFIGLDVVGKEELLLQIASALNWKIHVSEKKMNILEQIWESDERLEKFFEVYEEEFDSTNGRIVAIPKTQLTYGFMLQLRNSGNRVVGLVPSAFRWRGSQQQYKMNMNLVDSIMHKTAVMPELSLSKSHQVDEVHMNVESLVSSFPYSLHSSFGEIKKFVERIGPAKIVPLTSIDDRVEKHLGSFIQRISTSSVTSVVEPLEWERIQKEAPFPHKRRKKTSSEGYRSLMGIQPNVPILPLGSAVCDQADAVCEIQRDDDKLNDQDTRGVHAMASSEKSCEGKSDSGNSNLEIKSQTEVKKKKRKFGGDCSLAKAVLMSFVE